MYVRHLGLQDFRSWAQVDLDLEPGRTVFVAPNGYGKTNLVEALWYSATLGSHRVASDAPLLRAGAERAIISTIVVNDGRELAIDLEVLAGRANKARLNRSPVRSAREVLGVLRAVMFAPEDLALVRGDPAERRRYLDELATTRRPRIAAVRADYDKVLRQRTALLKTAGGARHRGDRSVADTLDVCGMATSLNTARSWRRRHPACQRTQPRGRGALPVARAVLRPAATGYRSKVEVNTELGSTCSVEFFEAALLDALARRRDAEIERGVCLVGHHRDDLELRLGDCIAKGYASHGESWSMALALRLAAYGFARRGRRRRPGTAALLDVFAELDSARRRALAGVAASAEQVLVTAAVGDCAPNTIGMRARYRDHSCVMTTVAEFRWWEREARATVPESTT